MHLHRLIFHWLAIVVAAVILLDASPAGAWAPVVAQDEPVVLDASQTQMVRSQDEAVLMRPIRGCGSIIIRRLPGWAMTTR